MTRVREHFGVAALILAAAVALGCAPRSTAALERARAAYQDASRDEQVIENAPLALQDAEQTLEKAERSPNEKDTASLAYVVERKVEIAKANADERVAEELARRLGREQKASAPGGCGDRRPHHRPPGSGTARDNGARSCRPIDGRVDARPARP